MYFSRIVPIFVALLVPGIPAQPDARAGDHQLVLVGGKGNTCKEDPGCFNRLHPDIPAAARAAPGQTILFRTRDAADALGVVPAQTYAKPASLDFDIGRVHPLTGPVYIDGARAGDVLAVTIKNIDPGRYAWTLAMPTGFAGDLIQGPRLVIWRLDRNHAVTDGIPGVKVPNSSFPGVITTLPGPGQLEQMLAREQALEKAGGTVRLPDPHGAVPADLCGPGAAEKDRCLRTTPPREHGGNMDIRYLQAGVTVYLPCYIAGCGLAIGDLHYAQGDGEVSGTAIEMSADVWVETRVLQDGPDLRHGPHYAGPASLLDIPSRTFYAVTGLPLKPAGFVPPGSAWLQSPKIAGLQNLSGDIRLATRNALEAMIDYITAGYGYDRQQAYIIASIAVDLHITQLVDMPNVGVTAILPLDIFTAGHPERPEQGKK